MVNLDDITQLKQLDPVNVLGSIEQLGKQCQQAWQEASQIKYPSQYQLIKNIVVCGMGGSRFTPRIVQELFKENISVPYIINDNYTLPKFVNSGTLVILSSYSGTTEEVIVCGHEAIKRGAQVTGICSGGEVAKMLKSKNLPLYVFNPQHNPCGQPRIGVGYMFAGHAGLLKALKLLDIDSNSILKAVNNLSALTKYFSVSSPTSTNLAKQTALKLFQKYPFYITAEHLQGVGNAIANQTNENAKTISDYRFIPELNHHLMEGLSFPEMVKQLAIFIFFTSNLYTKPVQIRFAITKEVVEKNGLTSLIYELRGKNRLEQALELISFGSYMTYYLAFLYQQDPSQIPWVDYFKKKLHDSK